MIKTFLKIILICSYILLILVSLLFRGSIPRHYFTDKPPCVNTDSLFRASGDSTSDHKIKILKILKNSRPSDYRYFFKTFTEPDRNYMLVNMRNDTCCFDVEILVLDWNILAGMRRTNGVSYPKELYDLEWEIDTVNGKEEVVYKDMHAIID